MIAGILQLPDLRGQAGLDARSEVHLRPRWFIALQHPYRRLLRQRAAMVLITQFTFGTGVRNKRACRAAGKDASRQQAPIMRHEARSGLPAMD